MFKELAALAIAALVTLGLGTSLFAGATLDKLTRAEPTRVQAIACQDVCI